MPKPRQKTTVIAVFIHKKSAIVKHWKRTDEIKTLCGTVAMPEVQASGIARECLVCTRAKADFEEQQRKEIERLQAWT